MRRFAAAFVALAVLVPAVAMAHAPADVTVALSEDGKVLKVAVAHDNGGAADHFVKAVKVMAGDKVLGEMTFDKQSTKEAQEFELALNEPLAKPVVLKVVAECSKEGKLEKDVEVK